MVRQAHHDRLDLPLVLRVSKDALRSRRLMSRRTWAFGMAETDVVTFLDNDRGLKLSSAQLLISNVRINNCFYPTRSQH